jgi:putative endonuclease
MYYTYIIQCADTTFYTGITTNIDRRVLEHNTTDRGAKYTRFRRPVTLVYCQEFLNRSNALKEEARIKKLSRKKKAGLIDTINMV